MKIRTARLDDLDAVTAIYNAEVVRATSTFDTVERTGERAREWFESHDRVRYPVLVAEEAGEVVAWASLSPWSPRGGYERTVEASLFVKEGHRGLGLGAAMTDELLARAHAAGHGVVVARVERGNEVSRRLLLASGFTSVGVMHRVGEKFGRVLDVEIFERVIR